MGQSMKDKDLSAFFTWHMIYPLLSESQYNEERRLDELWQISDGSFSSYSNVAIDAYGYKE
jgi:hypothetical protein